MAMSGILVVTLYFCYYSIDILYKHVIKVRILTCVDCVLQELYWSAFCSQRGESYTCQAITEVYILYFDLSIECVIERVFTHGLLSVTHTNTRGSPD